MIWKMKSEIENKLNRKIVGISKKFNDSSSDPTTSGKYMCSFTLENIGNKVSHIIAIFRFVYV